VIIISFGVNTYGDIIVEDNGPLDNRYTWDITFSGGKYTITIKPNCWDVFQRKFVLCDGGIIEITSTTNNDIIALLDYQADGFLQPAIQVKASTSGNKIAAIDEIRDTSTSIGAIVTADVIGYSIDFSYRCCNQGIICDRKKLVVLFFWTAWNQILLGFTIVGN